MKRNLIYSLAVLAMTLFVGCSHDVDFTVPTNEEALKNATEKLGVEIDPDQNWNAATAIQANVSVNLGLDDEYTVVIYDKNPLFNDDVFYYAKTTMKDGETTTLQLDVPSADSVFYAAVFDSKYRRIVQTSFREDSLLNVNFGTTMSEARSTRAIEADYNGNYAKTLNDYLNILEWTVDTGNEWWHNYVTYYGVAVTEAEMQAYPAITDEMIRTETSNGNHSLSDKSWYYNPADYLAHGDGQHYRISADTEIREVFHINSSNNAKYNNAVIYVQGKVHLNGNTLNGPTLVVANGGEVIIDGNTVMSNAGRFIVYPGGKITSTNGSTLNISNGAPCYNAGTIDMSSSELDVNGCDFYNCGKITVRTLQNTSSGGKITNFGSITANNNNSAANTYNCEVVNGCYMSFAGNAGLGKLKMLNNSRVDVGGKLETSGTIVMMNLSEINTNDLQVQMTSFQAPTASGEFAVLKINGDIYAGQGADFSYTGNLCADWDKSSQGLYVNNSWSDLDNQWSVYGIIKGKMSLISESTSPYTIPSGDCTGTGYHDTTVVPDPEIPGEPAVWTYAFEDTPLGDYDMNDVVIRVNENAENKSRLDVTLCCTGAAFNLEVYLDDQMLFAGSGKEVHAVFGQASGTFINTVNDGIKVDPITETIAKPEGFSFETADFWIKTPYMEVHIAKQGEDPHGIVVPGKWRWPREWQCIKNVYPNFIEFAKDASTTDETIRKWYQTTSTNPVEEYIYTAEE